jgi:hypothetical protein
MIICPYCAHNNLEGVLYCEECGESLTNNGQTSTKQLERVTNQLTGKSTWGTARFAREASIILHIRDANDPIVLTPADEMTLGRADPSSTSKPGVDLTPFGAQEKGVSRMHATIRRGDDTLTLIDLGSVNGTHLNGQRLIPNQPRVLRDGDEIRLGKLVCHIFFK